MPKRTRAESTHSRESPESASQDEPQQVASQLHIGRACQRCRIRKIRCDRTTPCGACRTAGISCVNTPPIKAPQQRQRVLISKEYETKIDSIEGRLDGIERMLLATDKLLEGMVSGSSDVHSRPTPTSLSTKVSANRFDGPIIGDTSLLAHSRHAREVLESRLRSSSAINNDPAVAESLAVLHAIIRKYDAMQGPFPQRSESSSNTFQPLPPFELFVSILSSARARDALFIGLWMPFLSPEELLEICTDLYNTPQRCPTYRKVLAYGAMLYLFVENVQQSQEDHQLQEYIQALSHNMNLALRQSQALTTPSYETVLAATLGTAHAILSQDYAMAWTFNNISSRMCQDLGWHRSSKDRTTRTQSQTLLFWIMYYIDKCLTLRLGRSSTIQDYDISVKFPSTSGQGWLQWLKVMVDLGSIHAQIYEKLYSPGSFTQDVLRRQKTIDDVVAKLQIISDLNSQLPFSTSYRQGYMAYLSKSNDVVIGCLMTLVHRAQPVDLDDESFTLPEQCLQAARTTIRDHLDMVHMDKDSYDYITWSLLNCPFTPFIVLFSNIITKLDREDLGLLKAFTESFDQLDPRSVLSTKGLKELCRAFLTLAQHYVEATQRQDQDSTDTIEIDPSIPILPSALFDNWLAGTQDFLWDWSNDMFTWDNDIVQM